jgi:asparagine synthase (glutamine-hydrolysing)
MSDVPLGAFLSGGVDSTTVVSLMAQESSQPVKTFSIGFEDDQYNELPYARLFAERYGTEHHEFVVKPDAAEVLPLLVKHYNEPFADSSALPTYYVSKVTRQHVTVALSGDGGDEGFSGYDRYGWMLKWSRSDVIPLTLRKLLLAIPQGVLRTLPYSNARARIARGLTMLASRLPERYRLEMTTALKPEEKCVLYSRHFRHLLAEANRRPDPLDLCGYDTDMDELDWMMRHDQNCYLPDDLMVKTDIASMANSLEVRCPFLDHKLVEFAATIPSGMKRRGSNGKLIVKSVAKTLLPTEILNKPKSGFGIPLSRWLREDLADLVKGTLLDDRARRRGLFDPKSVENMVHEHCDHKRDWGNRLWSLLFLEMWFREFID